MSDRLFAAARRDSRLLLLNPMPTGTEAYPRARSRRLLAAPWLTVEDGADGSVLVTAAGGIAADRSIDLWSSLEEALEQANGALVVVDLTRVTGFDIDSIGELTRVAKASARRHLDLCAIVRPNSALEHYAHCYGLSLLLPIHHSLAAALTSAEYSSRGTVGGVDGSRALPGARAGHTASAQRYPVGPGELNLLHSSSQPGRAITAITAANAPVAGPHTHKISNTRGATTVAAIPACT
jgi:anti-anti-sigma regulatory factor